MMTTGLGRAGRGGGGVGDDDVEGVCLVVNLERSKVDDETMEWLYAWCEWTSPASKHLIRRPHPVQLQVASDSATKLPPILQPTPALHCTSFVFGRISFCPFILPTLIPLSPHHAHAMYNFLLFSSHERSQLFLHSLFILCAPP
jgi:hypothetical protein